MLINGEAENRCDTGQMMNCQHGLAWVVCGVSCKDYTYWTLNLTLTPTLTRYFYITSIRWWFSSSPIKPKFHLARHFSTRLDTFDVSSPCILDVSCLSNSTARHTRHDEV